MALSGKFITKWDIRGRGDPRGGDRAPVRIFFLRSSCSLVRLNFGPPNGGKGDSKD